MQFITFQLQALKPSGVNWDSTWGQPAPPYLGVVGVTLLLPLLLGVTLFLPLLLGGVALLLPILLSSGTLVGGGGVIGGRVGGGGVVLREHGLQVGRFAGSVTLLAEPLPLNPKP